MMDNFLTADKVINEILPKLIKEKPEIVKNINAVINIELTGSTNTAWAINLTTNPCVSQGLKTNAQCHLIADKGLFEDLLNQKKIKPWLDAYKSKALEVKGSLPTIIKIERLVSKLVN